MASLKKTRRRYDVFDFPVKETFPPDSPLAIDLVRLMAAYNDISEVIDWMVAHRTAPTKPIAMKKWRIRSGMQHRFLMALMHEALKIFDQLQSTDEFKNTEELLDKDGKTALRNLRLAQQGGSGSIRARLRIGRDKVIFHYDRDDFSEGLEKLLRVFPGGGKLESQVLLQSATRAYYVLPEDVRDVIIYRFQSKIDAKVVEQSLGSFLGEVTKLQKELVNFLEYLLVAYMKLRRIDHLFRHKQVTE